MSLGNAILGGAAGGIGGSVVSEALEPLFKNWNDQQRYMLLFCVVFILLLWFVLLPGAKRRR